MSINAEYINARIREINDAVQVLRELIVKDFSELTVHEKFSMRYLVIQLVEAASSICVHILLNAFKEEVEGFPECFTRLGVKDIVPEDLAGRLSSAARLRNLLVHRYWTIVDEKVYESVKGGLKDFEHFISYIEKFSSKDPAFNENLSRAKLELEFRYRKLSAEEKLELLNILKEKLEHDDGIAFAYVHGGFMERDMFRDVDVTVWIKDVNKAFYYAVDFSAKLEANVGLPMDVQVLNQAPLPFRYHVFTRGMLLFSKDEKLRLKIADETTREYLDLKTLREKTTTTVLDANT